MSETVGCPDVRRVRGRSSVSSESQRVAVVTGGGSGIGAAVGLALAEDGWTVVLAGRRKAALEDVVAHGGDWRAPWRRCRRMSPMRRAFAGSSMRP